MAIEALRDSWEWAPGNSLSASCEGHVKTNEFSAIWDNQKLVAHCHQACLVSNALCVCSSVGGLACKAGSSAKEGPAVLSVGADGRAVQLHAASGAATTSFKAGKGALTCAAVSHGTSRQYQ